jgi:ribose 5-phosphate isomerase RpiB
LFHLWHSVKRVSGGKGRGFKDRAASWEDAYENRLGRGQRGQAVARRRFGAYAILFCGAGIGVCIAANKVPGIRAALTRDAFSAERVAKSNNAQIITMGARVIGPELANGIVDVFLASEFDPNGPSAKNVDATGKIDQKNGKSL